MSNIFRAIVVGAAMAFTSSEVWGWGRPPDKNVTDPSPVEKTGAHPDAGARQTETTQEGRTETGMPPKGGVGTTGPGTGAGTGRGIGVMDTSPVDQPVPQ
jgi:hypothetical protein